MNQEPEIAEPLAKFHAQVYKNGRIAIPSNEREYFKIGQHDLVNLIIRTPNGRGRFWAQLTIYGRLTIPLGLRRDLDIKEGDFIEVLLVDYVRVKDIIGERGYAILREVKNNSYEILTPEQEFKILKSIVSKHMLYVRE